MHLELVASSNSGGIIIAPKIKPGNKNITHSSTQPTLITSIKTQNIKSDTPAINDFLTIFVWLEPFKYANLKYFTELPNNCSFASR